jgi:hypothetical protein
MDLLERYLQAVGQYLEPATKVDVLAELRVNLQAEMDDLSEEKQRPLTESEVAAILKAHGRPMLVAARYLPQRYLIGPEVFPFYLLTLRKAAPFVVLFYFVAHLAVFIFSPGPAAFAENIVSSLLQLVPVLLIFWALMTLTFAVLDYFRRHHDAAEEGEVVCRANSRPRGPLSLDVVRPCDSASSLSCHGSRSPFFAYAVRDLRSGVAPLLRRAHRSIGGPARSQTPRSCPWRPRLGELT